MVPVDFHDYFSGCATVAGALIGLLFVALSVSPDKLAGDNATTAHQIRAAAAFSALVNTLVIALVGLLPGASLGEAGLILALAGLITTAGLMIPLARERARTLRRTDVSMLVILLALYGLQLANDMPLNASPGDVSRVSGQGLLAIAFFLFGIARSWQLVGARNFSLVSAVAAVIQRSDSAPARPAAAGGGRPRGICRAPRRGMTDWLEANGRDRVGKAGLTCPLARKRLFSA